MNFINDPVSGQKVPIHIRHSTRAKQAKLALLPNREFELVLPHKMPKKIIPTILQRQQRWLTKILLKTPLTTPQDRFPDTINLLASQQNWTVQYDQRNSIHCRLRINNKLKQATLSGHCTDESKVKACLVQLLKILAKQQLTPKIEAISQDIGLPFQRLSFRNQKTRWGSCSSKGNISLNSKLLLLPEPLVRYVMIHELCHTKHMNHSPQFWSLVERFEPHYRQLDQQLNRSNGFIPLWSHG